MTDDSLIGIDDQHRAALHGYARCFPNKLIAHAQREIAGERGFVHFILEPLYGHAFGLFAQREHGNDALIQRVEDEIVSRKFIYDWGDGNSNTWDYMSALTYYSYLRAYLMIPAGYDETLPRKKFLEEVEGGINLEEYTYEIFTDAIESIAHIWLRVWMRYRKWQRECKMIKEID